MSGGSFWSSSWNHFNGRSALSSISKKKVREHIAIRVALCAPAWWVAPAQATTVTTLPDGSTLVGSSGGLEFHLIWDSSVSSAPPAFKQAVEAAAAFYTQVYSNAEVINIAVGWGEVDGMPISAGNLAEGVRPGAYLTYAQVMGGLNKHSVNSSVQRRRPRPCLPQIRSTRNTITCPSRKPRRLDTSRRQGRKLTVTSGYRKRSL